MKQGYNVSMQETKPEASCEISIILYMASEFKSSSTVNAIIATMKEHIKPIKTLIKRTTLSV